MGRRRRTAGQTKALGVGLATPPAREPDTATARSGGVLPAYPRYPVDSSTAAMRRNPWVWACVQAIVTDLCGLSLVAETGTGLARQQTTDHPTLQLLEAPSPGLSGRAFRRQLVVDLVLAGNAFVRVWRDARGSPVRLGRILPTAIRPNVTADGGVASWTLTDGRTLTVDEVLHVHDVSSSHDASVVLGDSPIEPIALGLQVQRDSRRQAGMAARRGRLEIILSPSSPDVALGASAVDALVAAYSTATEAGHGVYVVNRQVTATPISLSAREGEFLGIEDRTRAEVLAVFGVPPVRVSEPAANYGTAKQQMRTYWETLQGRAALIDDELSRLTTDGSRIRHSFAAVEALQTSTTERLDRAVRWAQELGVAPADAASYEGFVDAPIPAETASDAASSPFATVGLPALVGIGIIGRAAARRLLGVDETYAPTPEELANLAGAPSDAAPPRPTGSNEPAVDEPREASLAERVLYALARATADDDEATVRELVMQALDHDHDEEAA